MASTVSYTLSLIDRMSAPMKTITGSSAQTVDKFSRLQNQCKALQAATQDLGGSLSTLRQRMELLKNEKELINPDNLADIKRYNREIQSLEKQIDKLDNAGKKGGLSKYLTDIKGTIKGIVNPLTIAMAGAGLAIGGGMNLDKQFAKVNTTAQLEGAEFEKMKSDIIATARRNKVDVATAPEAFEKIISQTNDVGLSMQILDSTLKGSKAGFTETSVVADALAQSLSIIGKNNASASEILDTLFAAKRVGAGEFKDFANYMPGLIASADALGIKYKEVAGVYAYMTGMGNKASRADVLMNNMFSMLGRGEVVEKLKKAGVNVFDNGKIRSTVDIFRDMASVMSSMNDEQKSNFIEKLGVVDKEAKSSFMVMTADIAKLDSSLKEVANSAGETDKALVLSANASQRWDELLASFKGTLLSVGTSALPIVSAGITVLGGVLNIVGGVITGVTSLIGGWYDMLVNGNPLIWGLTSALGAAGVMLLGYKVELMLVSAWHAITAVSTGVLGRALTALNASMLASPVGWLVLGVSALAGIMVGMGSKTDKVTKSFAAFNAELAKSKAETSDGFAVAMQAAENTEERKEAIRKLNDQYGEYLPNLLSETSSNNDLTTALNSVNSQLERKMLNKFRDQALEDAMAAANEAKTEILNWMLDQVDPGQQKQLAADFNTTWDRISAGKSTWEQEEKHYQDKYDIGTGFFENLWDGGVTYGTSLSDWGTYSNVGGKMMDLQNAAADYYNDKQRVDLLYNSATPQEVVNNTTNNITNYVPYQAYNNAMPSYAQSGLGGVLNPSAAFPAAAPAAQALPPFNAARNNTSATTNTTTKQLIPPPPTPPPPPGGGSAASSSFNLDQIVTNQKGSAAYTAITSKLNKVKMASLAAAALGGVAMTSPALTVPTMSDGTSTQMVDKTSDSEDYNNENRQKTLNLDKFCDQIVIHIAKADDKGYDEIRRHVMEVLKEVIDGQ